MRRTPGRRRRAWPPPPSSPGWPRPPGGRRHEADGETTRDASAERGYEGTSIKLVSERSGLPASSIYWHFEDKDELIAAVIDRSFSDWVEALTAVPVDTAEADAEQLFVTSVRDAGEQLAKFPDFLRLGLMLVLEHRPEEPAARRRFQQARAATLTGIQQIYEAFFGGLTAEQTRRLAALTLAGSDGLFIAADDGAVDLADEFELLGHAVLGAARSMGWVPPDGSTA